MFLDVANRVRASALVFTLSLSGFTSCSEDPMVPSSNPPESQKGLLVVITSSQSVRLEWGRFDSLEDWYMVERREGEVGPYREVGTTADTAWTQFGLLASKSYSYRVHAYHDEERIRTTRTVYLPNLNFLPPVLEGAILSQSSILLKWRDENEAETGFTLYVNGAEIAQPNRGDSAFVHEQLQLGYTYRYHLIAVGEGYVSNGSNVLSIRLDLSQPEAPSLEHRSETEFVLSWSYEGPPSVDGFRVVRRPEGQEGFETVGNVGPEARFFTVSNPETTRVDAYAVEAIGGSGYAKRSALRYVGYGIYELSHELTGYGTPAVLDAGDTKLVATGVSNLIAQFDAQEWNMNWSIVGGAVVSLGLDRAGEYLLDWNSIGVCIYDASNGSRNSCWYGSFSHAELDPTGELFAAVTANPKQLLHVRTTDLGVPVWDHEFADFITAIRWSGDGQAIAVATHGREFFLLDRAGNILWTLDPGLASGPFSFSPDGAAIALGFDRAVRTYETSTGELLWSHDFKDDPFPFNVSYLQYSPMGETLAASGSYSGVAGLDGRTGETLWSWRSPARHGTFSRDGKRMVTAGTVWHTQSGLVQWSADFPTEWAHFLHGDRDLILAAEGMTRVYHRVGLWKILEAR